MRAAFLDGPWRGRIMDVEKFPVIAPVLDEDWDDLFLADLWMENLSLVPKESVFKQVTYYLHRLKFGKYCINVASINPAYPDQEDAFDLLFSDYAKQAEQV